jgi:uncharacterized protein (TIGR02271 family)
MPTPSMEVVRGWQGRTMVDRDGDRIGTITEFYLDTETGRPEWALVNTGLFGARQTFVPLAQASEDGDQVRVPYEKAQVKDAPNIEADGQLVEDEEAALYRHYGLDYDTVTVDSGLPVGEPGAGEAGPTGTAPTEAGSLATDEERGRATDDAMTRSEEELQVGTRQRERGRVRLRKYVVTEPVTQTVPVQREEARLEREPITEANIDAAMAGPDITEAEHEVTLREEEPVVEKRVVPKERVRLDKDVATEEREVSEEVRKERIEPDEGEPPR